MSRISNDDLRRLLAESEGDNYALAFRAAGRLGEISPELAAEVLELREAMERIARHNVPPTEPFNGKLCCHGRSMDEDCNVCTATFAAAALSPAPVVDAVKQGDAQ